MLLAINANNTNVKFTLFDGEDTIGEWRQQTSSSRTADEHAVWLTQLFKPTQGQIFEQLHRLEFREVFERSASPYSQTFQ